MQANYATAKAGVLGLTKTVRNKEMAAAFTQQSSNLAVACIKPISAVRSECRLPKSGVGWAYDAML